MVNGGRLSVPSVYDTPLSTADSDDWRGGPRPGASMLDAPIALRDGQARFLTDAFISVGKDFTLLGFAPDEEPEAVSAIRIGGEYGYLDPQGLATSRYDAETGTTYLLRPDGYVAARFRHPTRALLDAALSRAAGVN
jgi:3-(3-hydroxy-phenyl)propionate hydroxylase